MKPVSSSRSFLVVSFLAVCGAGTSACGGAPSTTESSGATRSADTPGLCTATTSCEGVTGAPPVITITCDTTDKSYLVQTVSPAGTTSYAGTIDANAPEYSTSTSAYGGSLETCQWIEANWGVQIVQSTCQYFSTYSATLCPGGTGSSSGGTYSGGKFGCKGTCQ